MLSVHDAWLVTPGTSPGLSAIDPASTRGLDGGHDAANAVLPRFREELADLQNRLWAEASRSLLVVLQGMDAAGKDGTVRHVFSGVNPQGTRVTAFKEPTSEELAHDFLWRVHRVVPRRGEIGIFNRSHYEDVVAVRVRGTVPEHVWRPRYRSIVGFERELSEEGTTIVKFFLHISKDEQKRRFEERLVTPSKRWKFALSDLADRSLWTAYQTAYEQAIAATSTERAPWYIIPADHKWYRNWAIGEVLLHVLRTMDPRYPQPPDLDGVVVK